MPVTPEQLIEAATDPAAFAALLQTSNADFAATERAGVDSKNRELLGKLDEMKPWRAFGDKTPEQIQAALDAGAAAALKLEAADRGVDNEAVEALAKERADTMMTDFRTQRLEADQELADRAEAAEKASIASHAKWLDERVRRVLALRTRGIVEGLETDVYTRLRPVFHEDEKTAAIVLRNPATGANLQGADGDMQIDELVEGLKSSNGADTWNSKGAGYFASAGNGGGDKPASGFRGRTVTTKKRSEMTTAERSALVTEIGLPAYQQLPA